jgi:hypothetical protein
LPKAVSPQSLSELTTPILWWDENRDILLGTAPNIGGEINNLLESGVIKSAEASLINLQTILDNQE